MKKYIGTFPKGHLLEGKIVRIIASDIVKAKSCLIMLYGFYFEKILLEEEFLDEIVDKEHYADDY